MAVSFAKDIAPLFTQDDLDCMAPRGILLNDYSWMSQPANAQNVYDHLTGAVQPQMPLGSPPWPQSQLDLFNTWMTESPPYQP